MTAIDWNETVIIYYRGKEKALLTPLKNASSSKKKLKITEHFLQGSSQNLQISYFFNYNHLMQFIFLVLFIFWQAQAWSEHNVSNFDFNFAYKEPCDEFPQKCVSLEDLVYKSLGMSWESRENIQKIFLAKASAMEKFGKIMPHLDIGSAYEIGSHAGVLAIPSSFAGFIFPNRWYKWKEYRVKAKSEIESFKALLANRALAVQLIYHVNQSQIWNIRIIEHYINQIQQVLEVLRQQKELGRIVSFESLAVLENMITKLRYDHTFQDNFIATYPELAMATGETIGPKGFRFILKPIPVVSLKEIPISKGSEFVDTAIARSPELKGLSYLIRAAFFEKKSNYYDIFDPTAGSEFGLGYNQRIKITRGNIKILQIQKEKSTSQIGLSIFYHLNLYNDGLRANWASEDGLNTLEEIRLSMQANLENFNMPFDINNALRYFEISYYSAIRTTYSYFLYLNSKAHLDRYSWKGNLYKIVDDYIKDELNPAYKKIRYSHSTFRKLFRLR